MMYVIDQLVNTTILAIYTLLLLRHYNAACRAHFRAPAWRLGLKLGMHALPALWAVALLFDLSNEKYVSAVADFLCMVITIFDRTWENDEDDDDDDNGLLERVKDWVTTLRPRAQTKPVAA